MLLVIYIKGGKNGEQNNFLHFGNESANERYTPKNVSAKGVRP